MWYNRQQNKEGKCKMKEQIITEIAEILQSYSEERLKLIVRLVTVLATATDRTAGLSSSSTRGTWIEMPEILTKYRFYLLIPPILYRVNSRRIIYHHPQIKIAFPLPSDFKRFRDEVTLCIYRNIARFFQCFQSFGYSYHRTPYWIPSGDSSANVFLTLSIPQQCLPIPNSAVFDKTSENVYIDISHTHLGGLFCFCAIFEKQSKDIYKVLITKALSFLVFENIWGANTRPGVLRLSTTWCRI